MSSQVPSPATQADLARSEHGCVSLMDVSPHQEAELVSIELAAKEAAVLLDSGIVPGCSICRLQASPSGDPVVSADGVCFAMRKETARRLRVRLPEECELRRAVRESSSAKRPPRS